VVRRIAIASLVFAWLCANGALWDALQMAAWSRMFAGYVQSMPITRALSETFDAAKPCEMCIGIAKARDVTEKQVPRAEPAATAKFVLVIPTADAPVFANDPGEWPTSPPCRITQRTDPVPLPPPRV
jgi:hypothetical protein